VKAKLLHEQQGEKTFVLIFDTGDEVVSGLLNFARDQHLDSSHFTALGAFSDVVVGYFDWKKKYYKRIPLPEQVEVLALLAILRSTRVSPRYMRTWSSAKRMGRHTEAISSRHTCGRPGK